MTRWGLAAVAAMLSMGAMAMAQEAPPGSNAPASAPSGDPPSLAVSPTSASISTDEQRSARVGSLELVPGTFRLTETPQSAGSDILRAEVRHIETGVLKSDVVIPRFLQPDFVIKAGQPVYRQSFNVPRNGNPARPEPAWCAPLRGTDGSTKSGSATCFFAADEPGRAQYAYEALTMYSTPWSVSALGPLRAGTIPAPVVEPGPVDFGVKLDLVVEITGISKETVFLRRRIESSDRQSSPLEIAPWFPEADGTIIITVLGKVFRLTPDETGRALSIAETTLPADAMTATQRVVGQRIVEFLEQRQTLIFTAEAPTGDPTQPPRTLTPGAVVFSQTIVSPTLTAQNETPFDRERQFGRPGMRLVPIVHDNKQLNCARFVRRDRGETRFCLLDEDKDGKAERIYREVEFIGQSTLAIASLGEDSGMARPVPIGVTQNEVLRETLSLVYLGRRTDAGGDNVARFAWRSLPQGQNAADLLVRNGMAEPGKDVLIFLRRNVSAQPSVFTVDQKPVFSFRSEGAENIVVSEVAGLPAGPVTLSNPKEDARELRKVLEGVTSPPGQ